MDPTKQKLLVSSSLALIAALSAWLYLSHRERDLLRRGEMVEVVVARRYIPAYARIEKNMLALKDVPREYAPLGAVLDHRMVLGQLTLVPFNVEEPLVFNKLAETSQALSNAVPEGKRAFSVPVDRVSGVSGFPRPGDLVDVHFLAEGSPQVSTLFQAVPVLAAGQLFSGQAEKADTGGTLTLALSPEDCQIAFLALAKGVFHLSLRAKGDSRHVPLAESGLGSLFSRGRRREAAPAFDDAEFTPSRR